MVLITADIPVTTKAHQSADVYVGKTGAEKTSMHADFGTTACRGSTILNMEQIQ